MLSPVPVVDLSECRVCSNGLLEMRRRVDSGEVYAECVECMTGYRQPDMEDSFRAEDAQWSSEPASISEVRAAGWPFPEERP